MKKPFVSIVIPYYNKKDTIKRSIQSVLNQTYTNWELIIVDDKGQEPLEWEENWNLLPIKLLRNPENLGAAQTRQRGQDIARGEYIAFLDADDWWGNKFLEVCVHCLNSEFNCAGCYVITLVRNSEKEKFVERQYSTIGLNKIIETKLKYSRPWQTGGILWRKEYLGKWGKLRTHEDSWLEFKTAINNNNLVPIKERLFFVDRTIENSLSSSRGKKLSALDQQELFLMVYREFWQKINVYFKIILFHRLIRGQLKIHEYCPEYSVEMGELLIQLNPRLFWMRNQPFILKIIHYFLQNSPFKINF